MSKDAHSDETDRSGAVDMSGTGSCATPDKVLYGRLPGFGVGPNMAPSCNAYLHTPQPSKAELLYKTQLQPSFEDTKASKQLAADAELQYLFFAAIKHVEYEPIISLLSRVFTCR